MRTAKTLVILLVALALMAVPSAWAHHTPGENPADSVATVDDIECTDTVPDYREFVTEVDGERAYGIFAAPDTGTTPTALVVIGHGAWHTVDSWQDHIEGITAAYDTVTVAMEYRGLERVAGHLGDDPNHPEAKNWPEKKGGEDLIAAAKLFQAECGIDTVILAGVSMGVSISGYAVSHLDPSDYGLFDYWVTSEGVHSMLETYQAAKAAGSTAADWIEAETGGPYDPITNHDPYAERTNLLQTAAIEAAGLQRVIYLHATADGLVPYNQSREMSQALQVPFEFYTLTSAGEGSDGTSWTDYVADGEGPLAGHASERDPNSLLMRATFERIGAIATGNLADCGEYHVDEGAVFPDVEFQPLVTTPCGLEPSGPPPDARDDTASTTDRIAVDIDVLANDEGDNLTIVAFTQPEAGTVTENADGTLRYTPERLRTGTFTFDYTVAAPDGQTDTASVAVEVIAHGSDDPGQGEGRVHGSGWWDRGAGDKHDKVDFSFDARRSDGELKGKLKLKDKDLEVSIDAKTITSLSDGAGVDCNGVVLNGASSFTFTAHGTFVDENGSIGDAEFFACGVDNGKNNEPPVDELFVECTAGCDYSTSDRVDDNGIDGGNIHIHDAIVEEPGGGEAAQSSSSTEPQVIELGPMLLDTAPAGSHLVLTAVPESDAGLATNHELVLRWETASGSTGEATAITDAFGVATFVVTVPSGSVDYVVWSGSLSSNGVRLSGI